MLIVQMLTKNNGQTVRAALESVAALKPKYVVGDLGSTDDTLSVCREFGAEVHELHQGYPRHVARNKLIDRAGSQHMFWLEPWEAVVQGHGAIRSFKGGNAYATIIQNKTLTYDVRLWDGEARFVNPAFERLDVDDAPQSQVAIFSRGGMDLEAATAAIQKWKADEPLAKSPYYYHACVLLAQGDYDEFLKMADQYLFMDKTNSTPAIMLRYYYAMAQVIHKRAYKPALQNLTICLAAKPLMAEFWCLQGDVYYHLLHRFHQAKEFYENATVLGARRLRTDRWPMDLAKYREYPEKMMESCDKIIQSTSFYAKT